MDYEKKYDEYLKKSQTNYDLPGLTAGIFVDEKSELDSTGLSYAKSYGFTDIQDEIQMRPEHFSHMASISKTFTSCAAMKLWEEGKINFDDKVVDFLPWIDSEDKRFKDITFKHLITHTSGLPTVVNFGWSDPDIDSEALRRYTLSDDVREAEFLNTPGDNVFSYSDMGFELLGNIIQEISGMAFEEFIADRLFKPSGMDDSTMLVFKRSDTGSKLDPDLATPEEISKALSTDELLEGGLVMPHVKDGQKNTIRQAYYPYNRRHAPSSTFNSNVYDLKKWGDVHIKRSVLQPKTYEELWKTQTIVQNNGEGMGMGWFIRVQNGYTLYGHEGMDDGFRSSFWICPELKAQISVLSNIGRAPVKKISKKLFDILTIEG